MGELSFWWWSLLFFFFYGGSGCLLFVFYPSSTHRLFVFYLSFIHPLFIFCLSSIHLLSVFYSFSIHLLPPFYTISILSEYLSLIIMTICITYSYTVAPKLLRLTYRTITDTMSRSWGMRGGFWPVLNRIVTSCVWASDPRAGRARARMYANGLGFSWGYRHIGGMFVPDFLDDRFPRRSER